MLLTELKYGKLILARSILLLFIICISHASAAQSTFRLTGYVIGNSEIQPDVNVSVKNKKVSVVTNFKGKFTIECAVGDTLTFEKKYSRFAVELYVVNDSMPVIVRLVDKLELDGKGRPRPYGMVTRSNSMAKVYFMGTIHGDQFWGGGYNFYPRPFFRENKNFPLLNRFAVGFACYGNGNSYYLFPNVGLNIRSSYNNLFHSNFGFSFLAPSAKLGCSISNKSSVGFGYELGLTLLNFYFSNRLPFGNISIDVRYNNFLNKNGAFMAGLSFNKEFMVNGIPKFIKEAIR